MAEYIKREDAERALLERCKETGYGGLTPDDIRLVMRTPWRIPTADVVERKRGKWKTAYLDHEAFGVRPHTFYCSECQQISSFRTFFCPNCGADMRKLPKESES